MNRPYLWSVESLAGSEADKPSNSHLPLKRARGGVKFMVFKAPPLSSFIIMLYASVPTDMTESIASIDIFAKPGASGIVIFC